MRSLRRTSTEESCMLFSLVIIWQMIDDMIANHNFMERTQPCSCSRPRVALRADRRCRHRRLWVCPDMSNDHMSATFRTRTELRGGIGRKEETRRTAGRDRRSDNRDCSQRCRKKKRERSGPFRNSCSNYFSAPVTFCGFAAKPARFFSRSIGGGTGT